MDTIALSPRSVHTSPPTSPLPFHFSLESLTSSARTASPTDQLIWTPTLTPPSAGDASSTFSFFDMLTGGNVEGSVPTGGEHVEIQTVVSKPDSHDSRSETRSGEAMPLHESTKDASSSSTLSSLSSDAGSQTIDPALLSVQMSAQLHQGGTKRSAADELEQFGDGEVSKKAKFELYNPGNDMDSSSSYASSSSSSFTCSPVILRLTNRPAVHSPLTPFSYSQSDFIPPPRRRRAHELGLIKFALDPWLRLSRTLDTIGNLPSNTTSDTFEVSSSSTIITTTPPVPTRAFNPATFPSTGNLRELRRSSSPPPTCYIPFPPPGLGHPSGVRSMVARVDA